MKSRFLYLLSLMGAFLFYLFYNGYLSFMFFAFVLIVPIISIILSFIGYLKTKIETSLPINTISLNQETKLSIYRLSPWLPVGKIAFDLRTDQPLSNEILSEHYQWAEDDMTIIFTGRHCGKMNLEINHILLYDYFNIIAFKKRKKITHSLTILPLHQEIHSIIEQMGIFQQKETLYDPHRPGDDYSELFDIRNYREGDSINRIHWKLTNKHQELMVKEGSFPLNNHILLTFQLTHNATKNDTILSLFHSLALCLCTQDFSFEVAYKLLRQPTIQTITITTSSQYETWIHELMSLPLEKEYSHHLQIAYTYHYHINESGIYENNQLIGGDIL